MFLLFISCFKNPELVSIQDVDVLKVVNDTIALNVKSLILNPNSSKIKAEKISLDFYINNLLVGNGSVDTLVTIKGKSIDTVSMLSNIVLPSLSKVLPDITQKDSFPLDISMKAKFSFLKIAISKKFVKYIKTEEIINSFLSGDDFSSSIKFDSITVSSKKLDSSKIDMKITFVNSIPFEYKVKKVSIGIFNDKNKQELMGTSILNEVFELKKKEKKELPISIKVNNFNTIKGLFKNFLKKKKSIYIQAKVLVEINKYIFNVPISTEIEMPMPTITLPVSK
jgi:LEA14-like dessication related protein